jgi:hypothetical protein
METGLIIVGIVNTQVSFEIIGKENANLKKLSTFPVRKLQVSSIPDCRFF